MCIASEGRAFKRRNPAGEDIGDVPVSQEPGADDAEDAYR